MTRIRLLFSEAIKSIGANISTSMASAVSVLIGMLLIGIFIGIGTWLVSWSDDKKRELVVKIFFCVGPPECERAAAPKEINAVRIILESDERVKKNGITFISRAQALQIQRKRTPELTQNLPSNPLPASFEVIPNRGEDTEAIALSVRNAKLPGVDVVRYGEEVSKRVLAVARTIQIGSLIAVFVLLAASTIFIANTIRLSIFARRREIEVMKLVGATNWFVRGPFMLEGVLTGLGGSIAAILLLFLAREVAVPRIMQNMREDPDVHALAFTSTAAILLAVGLGIGALGSGLTIRRFLRV